MFHRRTRQEELSLREARLANPAERVNALFAVFPSAGMGVAQSDPATGHLVRVNPGLCTLTGYSEEELQGRSFLDFTYPEDCLRDAAAYEAVVEGSIPDWLAETRYVRKDGNVIWVQVHGLAIRDGEGQTNSAVSLIYDISRRKRVEAALSGSREHVQAELERLEQVFLTAPVGFCVLDLEGRFIRVNERLAEEHGFPVAAHLGATFWEIAPALAGQRQVALQQVLRTEEPLLEVELTGSTMARAGVRCTWRESWVPLRNRQGRIDSVSVVAEVVAECGTERDVRLS